MMTLVPIVVLFLTSITTQILRQLKRPIGSIWILSVLGAFIAWMLVLFFRFSIPAELVIKNWLTLSSQSHDLALVISPNNWPFAFLYVSLSLAILLTDATRFKEDDNAFTWTSVLALSVFGLLSILANSMLMLIIAWTLLDIFETVLLINFEHNLRLQKTAIVRIGTRISGTLLIMIATIVNNSFLGSIGQTTYLGFSGVLLLFGVILRLINFQINNYSNPENSVNRSLLASLKLAAPITVFAFISKCTLNLPEKFPIEAVVILSLIFLIYYSGKWIVAKKIETGISHWVNAFLWLVVIANLRGQPESILVITMVMVILGAWTVINTQRNRYFIFLFAIPLLLCFGLPFSPSSEIWKGLIWQPFSVFNIFVILSLGLLFSGLMNHIHVDSVEKFRLESWMKLFNIVGLSVLTIYPFAMFIWFSKPVDKTEFIVSSGALVLITILIILNQRFSFFSSIYRIEPIKKIFNPLIIAGKIIVKVIEFDWIIQIGRVIYKALEWTVNSIISLLEGDGGLLWSLVFLAIIATLIIGRQSP